MSTFDVCIRGGGAVGRCLALALSKQGLGVGLQETAAPSTGPDLRTYALNAGSVALLQSLKVWEPLLQQNAATPVYDMHVAGDAGGQLAFSAWQQRVSELAWIVDAGVLVEVLAQAVRFAPHVTPVAEDAQPDAALLAVCEGKASATREKLGVQFDRQPYGHSGVAARLVSDQAHQGQAWQWFGHPDILALLPFDRPEPGCSYGLVWSVPQARATELVEMPAAEFEDALNQATGGMAGRLTLASARASWPLAIARAAPWVGPGWVLVGDAAHQVHPLSGQGLNLGLADVVTLTRVLAERESWRPLGDEKLLSRYARARAAPTLAMGWITDGLWHFFAAEPAPLRELRNRGLSLVNHLSPLKRWLAARALEH